MGPWVLWDSPAPFLGQYPRKKTHLPRPQAQHEQQQRDVLQHQGRVLQVRGQLVAPRYEVAHRDAVAAGAYLATLSLTFYLAREH